MRSKCLLNIMSLIIYKNVDTLIIIKYERILIVSIICFCTFLIHHPAIGEEDDTTWREYLISGDYFKSFRSVKTVEKNNDWMSQQIRSWLYNIFGNQRRALATFRDGSANIRFLELVDEISESIDYFCSETRAGDRCEESNLSLLNGEIYEKRLFYLNEAHHISRHRAFAETLLLNLRHMGFTHLAAEALTTEISHHIVEHGFVPLSDSPYLHDPQFANLLITAHELGFKLISYEQTREQATACKDCDARERRISRERDQAANLLARTFEKDPDARVFAYGGFGHVRRCNQPEDPDFIPRAAYFLSRELGDDMITVSQTGSFWRREPTDGLEDAAREAQPLVLPGDDCVDMKIAHYLGPATYPNPIWKGWIDGRELRKVPLSSEDGPFPIAVEAFRPDQPTDTVPADRYTLWEPGTAYLWIPDEGARIYLRDGEDRLRPLE